MILSNFNCGVLTGIALTIAFVAICYAALGYSEAMQFIRKNNDAE